MNDPASTAILCNLIKKLADNHSWCGETHVQKATYFLLCLVEENASFRFQMYKHGPFSFDLSSKLAEMRANSIVELVRQPYPYGPSIRVCEQGSQLISNYIDCIFDEEASRIARFINNRGVTELERLATALYIINKKKISDPEKISTAMLELKPHLDRQAVLQSIKEVRKFLSSREEAK